MTESEEIEMLRQIIAYDPNSGVITRIASPIKNCIGRPVGTKDSQGYLVTRIQRKFYRCHRLAWALFYGKWPDGEVDHFDGDKANNRICNLRDVEHKHNIHNQSRPQGNNPYIGVHWSKQSQKWLAAIKKDGKINKLGSFMTPEAARDAYLEAKRVMHHPSWITRSPNAAANE
jgi:uncharacterized protein YeaC (DUF1315 family)